MRNLKSFNENLRLSDSMHSILNYLKNEYEDNVAFLLSELSYSDIYSDNEDINFIELAKQVKMFNFRPVNRRSQIDDENFAEEKSVSIKMGRLVKSVVRTVEKNFKVNTKVKGVIYRNDSPWMRNRMYLSLLFKGHVDLLFKKWHGAEKAEIELKIDGKEYSLKYIVGIDHEDKLLPNIFGNEKIETTEIYFKNDEELVPDFVINNELSLEEVTHEAHEIEIELNSNYETITDKDIEKFVDRTVAFIKPIRSDEDSKMKMVKGEKIRYWYHEENYQATQGELGNSCMADGESQYYLDIYSENKDKVSLLILVNKNNKLIGRALVWNLIDGRLFMDRAYTILPSDKYLFFNYAKSNNWVYKSNELGDISIRYKNEKNGPYDVLLEVQLDEWKFDMYPYLDTLNILNTETGVIRNTYDENIDDLIKLTDTDGGFLDI